MSESVISLNGIKLWGYHGCLPEERKIGSKYVIDISLYVDTSQAERTDALYDTIDYSAVYDIIYKQFSEPVNLLEHLAWKILDALHHKFFKINNSTITIQKLSPPIIGDIYSAGVTISYK